MPKAREQVDRLADLIRNSSRIVALTGAGISTAAGISDYRSKDGLWDRYHPVYYDEFIEDEEKRLEYWRRTQEMRPRSMLPAPARGTVSSGASMKPANSLP